MMDFKNNNKQHEKVLDEKLYLDKVAKYVEKMIAPIFETIEEGKLQHQASTMSSISSSSSSSMGSLFSKLEPSSSMVESTKKNKQSKNRKFFKSKQISTFIFPFVSFACISFFKTRQYVSPSLVSYFKTVYEQKLLPELKSNVASCLKEEEEEEESKKQNPSALVRLCEKFTDLYNEVKQVMNNLPSEIATREEVEALVVDYFSQKMKTKIDSNANAQSVQILVAGAGKLSSVFHRDPLLMQITNENVSTQSSSLLFRACMDYLKNENAMLILGEQKQKSNLEEEEEAVRRLAKLVLISSELNKTKITPLLSISQYSMFVSKIQARLKLQEMCVNLQAAIISGSEEATGKEAEKISCWVVSLYRTLVRYVEMNELFFVFFFCFLTLLTLRCVDGKMLDYFFFPLACKIPEVIARTIISRAGSPIDLRILKSAEMAAMIHSNRLVYLKM